MRRIEAYRKMLLLPLLLLAACSPAQQETPERHVEPRPFAGPAPRGEARLREAMLAAHNAARAAVGQAPLAWDAGLARDAAAYARDLARRGAFEHSKQPRGPGAQGENLWTGTRGAYRYEEMAQHWVDERRNYLNRPIPDISRTGKFIDAGHYAQIVWSTTTRVGCALASNRRDDVLVCRYSPAGNVVGRVALP
ncbi:serine protease [Sphingomonas suaedae]|uniref:Serine protease n=2 Tax=Sphingomonas suaedae TaxID=2599297 RepID=A0A518RLA0_9SPHN|nr:serine protease [Sphingomonas suaedae]